MSETADDRTEQPLTVAVLAPFPGYQDLANLLHPQAPNAMVVWTPYNEPPEWRSLRQVNGGRLPDGHDSVEIPDDVLDVWSRADVVLALDLPDNLDAVFPNLKWVQSVAAGVDHVDRAALDSMGVALTSASGVASVSLAEFVMGRLLMVWKHFRAFEDQQREQTWTVTFGTEVKGRTLAIVGLGAIGREVAKRARAFGMHVIATRASARPGDRDPDVDEMMPASALNDVLSRSDAVVSCVPLLDSTIDLFDASRFAAMKPGAIFCNVGRGQHVVEPDLVAALESGHLGAAVLDVTRIEPLPPGDPLWTAPNCYISPHSAVSLDRYEANIYELMADNFGRWLRAEPLLNVVG